MKPTIVIILLSLFFASCYRTEMNSCKKDYIEYICRLTKDGHSVYATINIKGKGKLLINTHDLYASDHIHAGTITKEHTDTLFKILIKKYWRPIKPLGLLEKRFIDMNIYHKIYKTKPMEVYNKFFNENGLPKNDKFSEQEIEAAVAYLIDCNTLILGGQMFLYGVNSPPIDKCNNYDKKRNDP
jgi:hypothetical protein